MSAEPAGSEREAGATAPPIPLRGGRTLAVLDADGQDLVEVRGAGDGVEVRILLTDEGPVLQLSSVRLALRAEESIDVEAPRVRVHTADALQLRSQGGIEVAGDADVEVTAGGDVRVTGSMIYLN